MTVRRVSERFALIKPYALMLATALAAASVGVTGATAQTGPAFAKLSQFTIEAFKANPQSLLTTYASGGLPLSTQTRDLVLTDASLVDSLIDIAKNANDAQKSALGAGLAQASQQLVKTNPVIAAQIQQKVAQSGLGPLITAYIAASSGTQTAATGGGGGGGGGPGGGSGPTGGVSGTAGSNGGANPGAVSFGTANAFTGNSSPGAGGSVTGGTTGGGTVITVTNVVSPI